ncbi:MAG: hypothetical protein IKO72_02295 [Kiritimatiellae bacterium]|nr:hypothetical protein [Kiritimatiellia bacterium]
MKCRLRMAGAMAFVVFAFPGDPAEFEGVVPVYFPAADGFPGFAGEVAYPFTVPAP